MNIIHCFKILTKDGEKEKLDDLTLLTQFLSAIKVKALNPNSKLVFYTDEYTLEQYKPFGLLDVYDEVNTEVFSNYPEEQINEKTWWATPKLWVMKHQTEPFILMDIDMVLHRPVEGAFDRNQDVLFLHTEVSTHYAHPLWIKSHDDWDWSNNMLLSFNNSLPFNCAVVGFSNMDLLKEYLDIYFDFILDNDGGVELINEENVNTTFGHIHTEASQITLEQWLLAALVFWKNHGQDESEMAFSRDDGTVVAHSLTDALSAPLEFSHQIFNVPKVEIYQQLSDALFHLWGAKSFYDRGLYSEYEAMKDSIIQGISIMIDQTGQQQYYDILEKLDEYCREIPSDGN